LPLYIPELKVTFDINSIDPMQLTEEEARVVEQLAYGDIKVTDLPWELVQHLIGKYRQ